MNKDPIEKCRELTPFEKMTQLAAKVVSATKEEVDRRQAEWRESREKACNPAPKAEQ